MSEYKIGERDLRKLGEYYFRHVSAMTGERLHSKSDIAAELAFRDKEIAEQRQEFVDELSIYLMDIHHGLTREDAKIVEYFLNATGESDDR